MTTSTSWVLGVAVLVAMGVGGACTTVRRTATAPGQVGPAGEEVVGLVDVTSIGVAVLGSRVVVAPGGDLDDVVTRRLPQAARDMGGRRVRLVTLVALGQGGSGLDALPWPVTFPLVTATAYVVK